MPWIVIDVALVLVGLVVLGLCSVSLWRSVKGLAREVGAAGETIGAATDELARLQAEGAARPLPEQVLPVTRATPSRRR